MNYDNEYENLNIKLVAKRVINNKYVHASTATKELGPFYCPNTFEELIVRKCREKRDHFAYKTRYSPVGSRESDLHEKCKEELLTVLQKSYPEGKWEKERNSFKADKSKDYHAVRPDLSGRINGKGIIIEIQASTLSIEKILHRTEQYSKRGAYILWIVPLEEDLGTEKFRPRLFERYLHRLYYGRVYYWYRGDGSKLTPVHYDITERYIEETNWFEIDGTERMEGGYYKPYQRIKNPNYGQKVDLLNDFKIEQREAFELKDDELLVPKCNIFLDTQKVWWDVEK